MDDPMEDFGSFEDFLKGLKPGENRPLSGLLRYRQGADPLDWSTPGATKYIPGSWQLITGSIKWTGAAAMSGVKEWNLAVTFANNPIIIASPFFTWPIAVDIRCLVVASSWSAAEVWWWSASNLTQCAFHWLALGPIGT